MTGNSWHSGVKSNRRVGVRPTGVLAGALLVTAGVLALAVAGWGVTALSPLWAAAAILLLIGVLVLTLRGFPLFAVLAAAASAVAWGAATRTWLPDGWMDIVGVLKFIGVNLGFDVPLIGAFLAALMLDARRLSRTAIDEAVSGRRWWGKPDDHLPRLKELEVLPSARFFALGEGGCTHLVVAGRRVALFLPTVWPHGEFTMDASGQVLRGGRLFVPGSEDVDGLAAEVHTWREQLGKVGGAVRGYLVVAPSRGDVSEDLVISVAPGEHLHLVHAHEMVEAAGRWLAAEPYRVELSVMERLLVIASGNKLPEPSPLARSFARMNTGAHPTIDASPMVADAAFAAVAGTDGPAGAEPASLRDRLTRGRFGRSTGGGDAPRSGSRWDGSPASPTHVEDDVSSTRRGGDFDDDGSVRDRFGRAGRDFGPDPDLDPDPIVPANDSWESRATRELVGSWDSESANKLAAWAADSDPAPGSSGSSGSSGRSRDDRLTLEDFGSHPTAGTGAGRADSFRDEWPGSSDDAGRDDAGSRQPWSSGRDESPAPVEEPRRVGRRRAEPDEESAADWRSEPFAAPPLQAPPPLASPPPPAWPAPSSAPPVSFAPSATAASAPEPPADRFASLMSEFDRLASDPDRFGFAVDGPEDFNTTAPRDPGPFASEPGPSPSSSRFDAPPPPSRSTPSSDAYRADADRFGPAASSFDRSGAAASSGAFGADADRFGPAASSFDRSGGAAASGGFGADADRFGPAASPFDRSGAAASSGAFGADADRFGPAASPFDRSGGADRSAPASDVRGPSERSWSSDADRSSDLGADRGGAPDRDRPGRTPPDEGRYGTDTGRFNTGGAGERPARRPAERPAWTGSLFDGDKPELVAEPLELRRSWEPDPEARSARRRDHQQPGPSDHASEDDPVSSAPTSGTPTSGSPTSGGPRSGASSFAGHSTTGSWSTEPSAANSSTTGSWSTEVSAGGSSSTGSWSAEASAGSPSAAGSWSTEASAAGSSAAGSWSAEASAAGSSAAGSWSTEDSADASFNGPSAAWPVSAAPPPAAPPRSEPHRADPAPATARSRFTPEPPARSQPSWGSSPSGPARSGAPSATSSPSQSSWSGPSRPDGARPEPSWPDRSGADPYPADVPPAAISWSEQSRSARSDASLSEQSRSGASWSDRSRSDSSSIDRSSGQSWSDSHSDPRSNPQSDPRSNRQSDPRSNPRSDPRSNPQADPRSDPRSNPQADPRSDPRSNPQADPRSNPRSAASWSDRPLSGSVRGEASRAESGPVDSSRADGWRGAAAEAQPGGWSAAPADEPAWWDAEAAPTVRGRVDEEPAEQPASGKRSLFGRSKGGKGRKGQPAETAPPANGPTPARPAAASPATGDDWASDVPAGQGRGSGRWSETPDGPGSSDRPGLSERPSPSDRPGFADRPGLSDRPGMPERPGLSERRAGTPDRPAWATDPTSGFESDPSGEFSSDSRSRIPSRTPSGGGGGEQDRGGSAVPGQRQRSRDMMFDDDAPPLELNLDEEPKSPEQRPRRFLRRK